MAVLGLLDLETEGIMAVAPRQYGVTSHSTGIFSNTAVKTSNLTFISTIELSCLSVWVVGWGVIVPFTRWRDLRSLKELTLNGQTLHLATEVTYLGLITDKELTWKVQLNFMLSKTSRAFWICKGTFCKTWCLKPSVVHWIYTKG